MRFPAGGGLRRVCGLETSRTRRQQRPATIYNDRRESAGLRRGTVFAFAPTGSRSADRRELRRQQRSATIYNGAHGPPALITRRHGRFAAFAYPAHDAPRLFPLVVCLFSLLSRCIALASCAPFLARKSIGSGPAPPHAANCALVFSLIFTSSRCSARVVNFVGRNSEAYCAASRHAAHYAAHRPLMRP